MFKLLLKLNICLIVVAVGRHVIDVGFSIFIVDDDFTIFIMAILQLLYEKKVCVASDITCGGCRWCDALHKGTRSRGGKAEHRSTYRWPGSEPADLREIGPLIGICMSQSELWSEPAEQILTKFRSTYELTQILKNDLQMIWTWKKSQVDLCFTGT